MRQFFKKNSRKLTDFGLLLVALGSVEDDLSIDYMQAIKKLVDEKRIESYSFNGKKCKKGIDRIWAKGDVFADSIEYETPYGCIKIQLTYSEPYLANSLGLARHRISHYCFVTSADAEES